MTSGLQPARTGVPASPTHPPFAFLSLCHEARKHFNILKSIGPVNILSPYVQGRNIMNPDERPAPGGKEGSHPASQEKGEVPSSSPQGSEGQYTPRVFVHSFASTSKWLFLLAVVGTGVIAVVLFGYGFLLSLYGVYFMILNFSVDIQVIKEYLATAVQIIDIFLVATVFYLISMGLYELFIARAPLPGWVEIRNLDDLKTKLLGLTVIALAVIFLGTALTLSTETGILELGAAIGIMIAAIAAYLWVKC